MSVTQAYLQVISTYYGGLDYSLDVLTMIDFQRACMYKEALCFKQVVVDAQVNFIWNSYTDAN